jgi:hypothetical protein
LEDPVRASRIERMSDLVFTTRPARSNEVNAVGIYVRTEKGMDGFGYKSENDYRLMTAYEALKFFESEPSTPTLMMLEEHFGAVQGLVHTALQQPKVLAGQISGVRKRVYIRLKSNLNELSLDVAKALEALYEKPLTAEAEFRLKKALDARSAEDLGSLISALHSDNRLVITDGPGQDPVRIVCSMGVSIG